MAVTKEVDLKRAERSIPVTTMPLANVARLAARVLGAPMASLVLADGAQVGTHGLPAVLVDGWAAQADPLHERVLVAGRPLRRADLSKDPALADHPLLTECRARAYVAVPLPGGGGAGVLAVLDTEVRRWTQRQVSLLVEVAATLEPAPPTETSVIEAVPDGTREAFVTRACYGVKVGWNRAAEGLFVDGFNRALLESLQVGVVACDQDGRLVVANGVLRDLHQLSTEVGGPEPLPLEDILAHGLSYPDGRAMPVAETPLLRAKAGETVDRAAVHLTIPERFPRELEVTARPIHSSGGGTVGAVAILHDVTEQRRLERFRTCELLAARALAEASSVADVGPAMVQAVAGAMGWPHAQLWLVDEVAAVLRPAGVWNAAGFDPGDLIPAEVGHGWGIAGTVWATGEPMWIPDIRRTDQVPTSIFPEWARTSAAHGVRAVVAVPVRDGRAVLGVLTGVADRVDTGDRHPHDSGQLVALLGGVANQVGHFLARRRAEDLALQLARTKDDYVALVGHELRAPLTSIANYTELLAAGAREWTLPEQQLLEVIGRNTAALRSVTDDLLDLMAIEGGAFILEREAVDLAALLADAVRAVLAAAAANKVDLRTNLPEELLLQGDPDRLRRILDNLLTNAVKYSPDGGGVYVRLLADATVAELTVIDSGIGIPPEERHQLFRRFYRSSTARERGIPGTGLGLSIARALTEAHHGAITVTDTHEHGTKVTVRLPIGQ